jgi:hypothetical protein
VKIERRPHVCVTPTLVPPWLGFAVMFFIVMPVLVTGIHAVQTAWMAGTSPAMMAVGCSVFR